MLDFFFKYKLKYKNRTLKDTTVTVTENLNSICR